MGKGKKKSKSKSSEPAITFNEQVIESEEKRESQTSDAVNSFAEENTSEGKVDVPPIPRLDECMLSTLSCEENEQSKRESEVVENEDAQTVVTHITEECDEYELGAWKEVSSPAREDDDHGDISLQQLELITDEIPISIETAEDSSNKQFTVISPRLYEHILTPSPHKLNREQRRLHHQIDLSEETTQCEERKVPGLLPEWAVGVAMALLLCAVRLVEAALSRVSFLRWLLPLLLSCARAAARRVLALARLLLWLAVSVTLLPLRVPLWCAARCWQLAVLTIVAIINARDRFTHSRACQRAPAVLKAVNGHVTKRD
jgi:hypothetical protein